VRSGLKSSGEEFSLGSQLRIFEGCYDMGREDMMEGGFSIFLLSVRWPWLYVQTVQSTQKQSSVHLSNGATSGPLSLVQTISGDGLPKLRGQLSLSQKYKQLTKQPQLEYDLSLTMDHRDSCQVKSTSHRDKRHGMPYNYPPDL